MTKYLLLVLSWANALFSAQELVVPLATKSPLTSIYLGKLQRHTDSHASEYTDELERILLFDLKYGGKLVVAPQHRDGEAWLEEDVQTRSGWPIDGVEVVIHPNLHKKSLTLHLYDSSPPHALQTKTIALSGNITDDRRRVHTLVDAIHSHITGYDGIASMRILYAKETSDSSGKWTSEIWECDFDGGNAHAVTSENSYCITPTFLPSKRGGATSFAYVNYKLGQPKIYLGSFKDGKGKPCVDLRGNQLLPTFSKAGNSIAFICDASGQADLFVQAFDQENGCVGKPIQAYSFPRSVQASPTFSPDGNSIAFVSDKDGTPRIYVISTPRGSRNHSLPKAKCLTTLYKDNTAPCWSPDGTKLAYSARVEGVRQIMVYDCGTHREMQLTSGPGHKENPSWARDNLHLVYNSVTEKGANLFLVSLYHTEPIQITTGPGRTHYPAWEP